MPLYSTKNRIKQRATTAAPSKESVACVVAVSAREEAARPAGGPSALRIFIAILRAQEHVREQVVARRAIRVADDFQREESLERSQSLGDSKHLKPGQPVPASGQYEIIGPRGGSTGKERTMAKGETAPPTPAPGQTYKIVDRTKNQSGRG